MSGGLSIRILPLEPTADDLAAWNDLAASAVEPNVFYEPWMLLPALRLLREGRAVELVAVVENERFLGFFPIERDSKFRGLPLGHDRMWKHQHCFLCTPLIRQGRVKEVLEAFTDWQEKRAGIFIWDLVAADEPVGTAILELSLDPRRRSDVVSFDRAALMKPADPEAYLTAAVSKKHLRESARVERRLAESGKVTYEQLKPSHDAEPWIQEFLQIEASGWKGRARTAMDCIPEEREFFLAVTRGAHAEGKLSMYRIRLDDRTLSTVCEFHSGDLGYSFKSAYDEAFAQYRAPTLLEIWHVRDGGPIPPHFVDSCADPGHPLLDRFWKMRRRIMKVTMARRAFPEGLVVRGVSEARRLRDRFAASGS